MNLVIDLKFAVYNIISLVITAIKCFKITFKVFFFFGFGFFVVFLFNLFIIFKKYVFFF